MKPTPPPPPRHVHMRGIPWLFWLCHPILFVLSLWCALTGHSMVETPEHERHTNTDATTHYCEKCGAQANLERTEGPTCDTVTIPRDLLSDLLDHAYFLRGEWKRGSLDRYQDEIDDLDETIRQAEQALGEDGAV